MEQKIKEKREREREREREMGMQAVQNDKAIKKKKMSMRDITLS